jgi:hypothetical protein
MSEQPNAVDGTDITDDQASALLADAVAAEAEPADLDGYQKLVEKLRGENRSLKSDRTPQDEKDARTIAALKRDLKAAEPKVTEYDRLTEASKTAEERAQGLATAAEARASKLLSRAVSAEVKALASQGFADPSDAAAFLDLGKYANAEGDVDTDAIATDLTDLLTRKPHLGKQATPGMRPNPAQGHSASAPLGLAEQIAASEKAGDTKATIRLKAAMALDHN